MIDERMLDNIIHGRIEPHIYAFSTNTIPNYLKVGDTFRAVEIRINEWKAFFPNLKKEFEHHAFLNQTVYYRDYAIHRYLEEDLQKKRLTLNDIAGDIYYSREFFQNTKQKDVEEAMDDIARDYQSKGLKYQFYDSTIHAPIKKKHQRDQDWQPRENQQKVIENFKRAVDAGRYNLLMYAVMRFGKSFTALCCAKEMDANLILVVSGKADVASEWKCNVERPLIFEGFEFFVAKDLIGYPDLIQSTIASGKKVVLFLTLQDLQGDRIKDKHQEVFGQKIDLLIIDETHYGARAEKYGKVLKDPHLVDEKYSKHESDDYFSIREAEMITKALDAKIKLHLSGTPYRILMGNEFEKEDIIGFCQYSDIVDAQNLWNEEHFNEIDSGEKNEWDNPYFGFPQMIRFALRPNKKSRDAMAELEKNGVSFKFSALFKTKSLKRLDDNSHKQFLHEDAILELFEVIDGQKEDDELFGFLDYDGIKKGMMCRHIVCVLPYCASCDALEDLIDKNRGKFKNLCDYQIINISGLEGAKKYNSPSRIKSVIRSKEEAGYKTMTLTVNRMLTGSTVPEWDTMMFFKDTASAQEYDQAIFRLQSQYIKECRALNKNKDSQNIIKINQKPQTLLIDFDPVRMFHLQEYKAEVCDILKGKSGGKVLHDTIKKELEVSPIIAVNAGKMVQVEAADIVKEVRNYAGNKSVMDEAADLPVDMNLLKYPQIHEIVQNQDEIGGKKGLTIDPHKGKTSELDTKTERERKQESGIGQGGGNTSNVTPKDLPADEQQKLEKKFKTYFMRILFYAYLTSDSVTSLSDIIHSLKKDENGRIAENLELDADILNLLNQNMDGFKLNCLDMKIHNINDLANDHALEPLDRAINALKRFDRFGSSEVRTPDEVCKKMVDMIPEGVLSEIANKKGRILDIAAKSGEFAIALYQKLTEIGVEPEIIKDMIYSIPTSGVSYEFTRKIYEILGLNIHNLAAQFTSYSLLDEIKKQGKDDKRLVNVLCQDKPFNCITLSGEEIENESENEHMRFDFCLGNPPYQEIAKNTSDIPVYDRFMEAAYTIAKITEFITPARFLFNAGKTPASWNKQMLNDTHFKVMQYQQDSSKVFPNTDIKGGVIISYKDNNQEFEPIECFIPYENLRSVLKKVNVINERKNNQSLSELINSTEYFKLSQALYEDNPNFLSKQVLVKGKMVPLVSKGHEYDLTSNILDKNPSLFFSTKPEDGLDYYRVCGRQGGKRKSLYILAKYLQKNKGLEKYKVVLAESNNDGSFGETLVNPFVAEKDIATTQTYITIGFFDTIEEANNVLKYIKCKFTRALLNTLKITQHNKRETWKNVPNQNFKSVSDIDWSRSIPEIDQQLYQKYGLNEEEIAFIENNVKEMV